DALALDGLTKVIDWRLEKILYYLELYNGWGYHAHGVPSPYLFGATSIQKPGKYIADGVWSATAIDKQIGCAALIKAMHDLDASVAAYVCWIRPILHSRPSLKRFHDQADGFWSALRLRFAGIKTLLVAAVGMAVSAIVALHDFLLPYAVGIDWTPITDMIPKW